MEVWLRLPPLMRAQKPNAQEREKLRRQRSETRLIRERCKELGFDYVVNPPKLPTYAFGRKIRRSPSGTMLDEVLKVEPGPGPLAYNCAKKIGFKYPSKAGFSALASNTLRLPKFRELGYPPLGTYDAKESQWTHMGYTFNKQVLHQEPKWLSPGTATYTIHMKYPKWNVEMAFGCRKIIWPSVAVFCTPVDISICMECEEKPVGDYFHCFSSEQDLCRKCMNAKLAVIKQCDLSLTDRWSLQREIKDFVPVRNCNFFHDHDGTTAATERLSRKILRNKIRVENYLYRFTKKTA